MKIKYLIFTVAISLISTSSYASGNAKKGEQQYAARCTACHSIEANLAGPMHRGVFGKKAGSVRGFDYSPALKRSSVIWNENSLDKWLTNPEKFIAGQQMGYSVSNAKDREDLIAFLKTQTRR